jgi:hypothetical protein
MVAAVDAWLVGLRERVSALEPGRLTGEDAAALVEVFVEGERLCAAGKALVARRAEDSNQWRREGHRSVAHWMAVKTGESVGKAVATMETARRLDELPATREAFCAGRLSETQANEIASAAAAAPAAENDLLRTASESTVSELRDRCRRVKAAAAVDAPDAYERIRRRRYLKHWTDRDGAMRLEALLTVDDGALVIAALDARRQKIFTQARKEGRREPFEAYAADALVDLARGDHNGPAAMVHIQVDHDALVRGHLEPGEICEVPGIGPLPLPAAQRLAGDAVLKALVTKGVDVTNVVHLGRTIPAHVRTALETRDPKCVKPGCDMRHGLEIHHWRIPYVEEQCARLENLARLCRFHHVQATHHGFHLGGGPGAWTWTGPDAPDPPAQTPEGQLPLPP